MVMKVTWGRSWASWKWMIYFWQRSFGQVGTTAACNATSRLQTAFAWLADSDDVSGACAASCAKLGVKVLIPGFLSLSLCVLLIWDLDLWLQTLDLYLVHWPGEWGSSSSSTGGCTHRQHTWRQMELLLDSGQLLRASMLHYSDISVFCRALPCNWSVKLWSKAFRGYFRRGRMFSKPTC